MRFRQFEITDLQLVSSRVSSDLLDWVGVNHLMEGNVLQLPSRRLFVDDACSGIVSVMSVSAMGAMFAVWKNRSLLHSILLVLSGVGWAVVMNVARIYTIGYSEYRWGLDLSEGWMHSVLGFVSFTIIFVAVASTDRILCFFLDPIGFDQLRRQEIEAIPWISLWNRFIARSDSGLEVAAKDGGACASDEGRTPSTLGTVPMVFVGGAFGILALGQRLRRLTRATHCSGHTIALRCPEFPPADLRPVLRRCKSR